MASSTIAAAAAAAFLVVVTPGPAVLAVLSIGTAQGRLAGWAFLTGHLVGDMLWAAAALALPSPRWGEGGEARRALRG